MSYALSAVPACDSDEMNVGQSVLSHMIMANMLSVLRKSVLVWERSLGGEA